MNTIVDDLRLLAVAAVVFLVSVVVTVELCRTMSGGMPMPGGWMMSTAWMRMPGQTWLGAAAWFLAMWLVMTVAMMMPSLAISLANYRRSFHASTGLTIISAAGYFFVWTVLGLVVYPIAVALTLALMRWEGLARAVPIASGIVIALAGALQLSAWKARQLGECRNCGPGAWMHGVRLGVRCALCCAGYMTVLLVAGVMDLRAMGVIAAAITAERLAPRPAIAARVIGIGMALVGAVVAGLAVTQNMA